MYQGEVGKGCPKEVRVWFPESQRSQEQLPEADVFGAEEAVDQGSATIGLKSKTHAVLLALESDPSTNQKILPIESHVGISVIELTADTQLLSKLLRTECKSRRRTSDMPLSIPHLVTSVGAKSQIHAQHCGRHPFGVGLLVAGYDNQGAHLYQTCPSGNFDSCPATAIGARSQLAISYLERHLDELPNCTLEKLIAHGFLALRNTLSTDQNLTMENCLLGIVGCDTLFRIYKDSSINQYLQLIEEVEQFPGCGEDADLRDIEPEESSPEESSPEESSPDSSGSYASSDDSDTESPVSGKDVYVREHMSNRFFNKGRIMDSVLKYARNWKSLPRNKKLMYVEKANEENDKMRSRSSIRKTQHCEKSSPAGSRQTGSSSPAGSRQTGSSSSAGSHEAGPSTSRDDAVKANRPFTKVARHLGVPVYADPWKVKFDATALDAGMHHHQLQMQRNLQRMMIRTPRDCAKAGPTNDAVTLSKLHV